MESIERTRQAMIDRLKAGENPVDVASDYASPNEKPPPVASSDLFVQLVLITSTALFYDFLTTNQRR